MTFNQICGNYGVCPHLNNVDRTKHSRGSLGSAPTSNVLELSKFHQGMFKYCTQYVQKGASYNVQYR